MLAIGLGSPAQAEDIPEPKTTEQIIASYDWDYETALFIAQCESSLNPEALNDNPATGDYSVGLFQINLYGGNAEERPTEEWLKVPENNISFAYELYSKGGWERHWRNCYNKLGVSSP